MKPALALVLVVVCLLPGLATAQIPRGPTGQVVGNGPPDPKQQTVRKGSPHDRLLPGVLPSPEIVIGGYFREDRSYVRPRMRKILESTPWNTLSAHEDRNQPGRPPSTYSPAYYLQYRFIPPSSYEDQQERLRLVSVLEGYGVYFDWQRHVAEELSVFATRAEKGKALAECGVTVDWREIPYWKLLDLECACRTRKELDELGVRVNAVEDCPSLQATMARVLKAQDIEALGRKVNWRDYSLDELAEMEQQLLSKRKKSDKH